MFFPALLAKFLSAGAVAQAATGAGVVVVAVAGAGTAGVLPGPVQDTFTSLVSDEEVVENPEDVTGEPLDDTLPDEEESADPTEVPAVPEIDTVIAEDTDEVSEDASEEPTEQELWAENGPAQGQSFGAWVAEGARNGWADGATVSEWAHKRNEERGRAAEDGTDDEVVEAPVDSADTAADAGDTGGAEATTRGGNRGKGAKPAAGPKKDRDSSNGQGAPRGNGRG